MKLLEENRAFGKFLCLLVYLVSARLDVDVMILWKIGFAAIKRVGSEWRSDEYPLAPILRQEQIAIGVVLRQITVGRTLVIRGQRTWLLRENNCCDGPRKNGGKY